MIWMGFFKELKFFENIGEIDSRKFVFVMINFYNFVFYNFLEIEEVKGEIKKKVIGCFYVKLIVCIYKY